MDSITDKIVEKYINFIPDSQRIEKIISIAKKVSKDFCKSNPMVEPITNEDLDLIKFCRSQRNSVHNGGIHQKSSELSFYGVTLKENAPSYFNDLSDGINLSLDLVTIYIQLIAILEINDKNRLFEFEQETT